MAGPEPAASRVAGAAGHGGGAVCAGGAGTARARRRHSRRADRRRSRHRVLPQRGVAWDEWDSAVLAGPRRLATLGRPLCVGVSRKSFPRRDRRAGPNRTAWPARWPPPPSRSARGRRSSGRTTWRETVDAVRGGGARAAGSAAVLEAWRWRHGWTPASPPRLPPPPSPRLSPHCTSPLFLSLLSPLPLLALPPLSPLSFPLLPPLLSPPPLSPGLLRPEGRAPDDQAVRDRRHSGRRQRAAADARPGATGWGASSVATLRSARSEPRAGRDRPRHPALGTAARGGDGCGRSVGRRRLLLGRRAPHARASRCSPARSRPTAASCSPPLTTRSRTTASSCSPRKAPSSRTPGSRRSRLDWPARTRPRAPGGRRSAGS